MYQQLVYDVLIRIEGNEYALKGFLDTGNQALYEGLPIVFLKKSLYQLRKESYIQTFYEKESINVIKGEIYFNQQWIICAFSVLERLEIQEDCLLNYYLL